ncbi:MAG: putative selenate reductase subunit YgfK [Treponema sp.]|jgi:putative selenate reductase|nr:putative selenate reductase subunit YgfK [Treponema sp.]
MSEIMRPIPFKNLVRWALNEYKEKGTVFSIQKEKFYKNKSGTGITLFGTKLGSPVGPAAGPNSQLAQNIAAAYLAGSRFMELKTVQVMDGEELRKCVPRPCINAEDEGYNVEWSTELTVEEAFDEYIKAWFLLHLFSKEFDLSASRDFAFNMSVGYSFEGITSPKIDNYIQGMKNASASNIWKECFNWLNDNISLFGAFTKNDLKAISPSVSPSITLSTLHGCPKEEIEKIASYLITEKGLHTYIKCNPTLLGYETARNILDSLGYRYISFDDHHFKDDLQFNDAVAMTKRLMELSQKHRVDFGVKITNTFPVEIKRGELPGSEMYMSGRALFPLSITVAEKLSSALEGRLPVSYSGGADFFNLKSILETGIRPITVATTILKPGGYERFRQLAELAEESLKNMLPLKQQIDVKKLFLLASSFKNLKRFYKHFRHSGTRKTASPLPFFDCYKAPCKDGGCPINQRIPEYLLKVSSGDYREAFNIIALDNTAPSITGTICDHQCQAECTRVDYDDPLEIRQAKLLAAENAQTAYIASLKTPPLRTDKSVGIVGAGPAGIAAAIYLKRNGVPVKVYEKRPEPYGVVSAIIPSFRISPEAITRDYKIALKLGIQFVFNVPEEFSVENLKTEHAFVILATGAWKEGLPPVSKGKENIIDALQFLEKSKASNLSLDLGKSVAVIGGGDVAMDCARAAKRNKGVDEVTIVYRRTRDFMPAQGEEIDLALEDGVKIIELLAPLSYEKNELLCEVTKLGDYDASKRRGIIGTGEKKTLYFDTVIGAVGARVDTGLFVKNNIPLNASGFPEIDKANKSPIGNVYLAGDCKSGAATVVKAIADSKIIALDIFSKLGLSSDIDKNQNIPVLSKPENCRRKKGIFSPGKKDKTDALRCLSCDTLCEICADVCPNRANMAVPVQGFVLANQIIHFDRMCNECGNCATFCPHAGAPYKDKFTLFHSEEDFKNSENKGVLFLKDQMLFLRLEDNSTLHCKTDDKNIPDSYKKIIAAIQNTMQGALL